MRSKPNMTQWMSVLGETCNNHVCVYYGLVLVVRCGACGMGCCVMVLCYGVVLCYDVVLCYGVVLVIWCGAVLWCGACVMVWCL